MSKEESIRNRLRQDALTICRGAIDASMPGVLVERAMKQIPAAKGKTIVISVGKAAWLMAYGVAKILQDRFSNGIIITKYGHSKGEIKNFNIFEAGHPIPDENSLRATEAVIEAVRGLSEEDQVILLLSGGGSVLFEKPLIPLEELKEINCRLLASGADITEVNTIRKRLSSVKGGRFGALCSPAHVYSILLSDVIGDYPDMIASGPALPDSTTSTQALEIAERYHLCLNPLTKELLKRETPKELLNVTTIIIGGVHELCLEAKNVAETLGYKAVLLTDRLQCEAREAGKFLGAIAQSQAGHKRKTAHIIGGETVVHLIGRGKGGRNQELALAAAEQLRDLPAVIISVGSDGTDGPTDAAGGIVDGETARELEAQNISIQQVLEENDAYQALKKCDGLVFTGPTGTNVNDVAVLLME